MATIARPVPSAVSIGLHFGRWQWITKGAIWRPSLDATCRGGFAMAVFVPLALRLNLKTLPKGARPNALHIVIIVLASLTYVGFALYCILTEVGLVQE
jgi:hypothetical protein